VENNQVDRNHDPRIRAYALIVLSYLFAGVSLLAWLGFNAYGAFGIFDFQMGESEKLLLNLGLSVTFFLQHSGMIRKSFRRTVFKKINTAYHSALFSISSGLFLLLVVLLWQQSAHTVISPTGFYRWLFHLLFVGAVAGFTWGVVALGKPDMLGIRPIVYRLRRKALKTMPFTVRGPYRLTRHPLYFFCILAIWSCPDITADRLMYNVLWTVWLFIGAKLEERDLVHTYGDEYRNYQDRVPMIIPYKPWI
jgi:protein-S-isoprenylcysteine O-methyltransferase Ste14